jgi:type II secretory ATPase GspE/PulE/Tfp pilus assembly ATPase PilB-like protein
VRKICEECKQPYEVSESDLVPHGHVATGGGTATITLYRGKGCAACGFTGLKGRIAIYEVLPVSRDVRDLVLQTAPPSEITRVAREEGMRTLREAGLAKVLAGTTTIDEVLRVTCE